MTVGLNCKMIFQSAESITTAVTFRTMAITNVRMNSVVHTA